MVAEHKRTKEGDGRVRASARVRRVSTADEGTKYAAKAYFSGRDQHPCVHNSSVVLPFLCRGESARVYRGQQRRSPSHVHVRVVDGGVGFHSTGDSPPSVAFNITRST